MNMMAMENLKSRVSCCQMTSTNNKRCNLDIVERLIAIAKGAKSAMVCFPEAADFISTDRIEYLTLSEPIDGPTMLAYRRLARNYEIWVSIGVHELIPSPDNDIIDKREVYNSHVVINNKGEIVAIYRKIHLFDVEIPERQIYLKESATTKPGKDIIAPFQTPIGTLGLATCYDLRFPEIGILLRKGGAQVISYPSAFTTPTGTAHWEQLLRARAIETQCYVIAPAQVGRHNEQRHSHGRAMIIDPWGVILDECMAYVDNYGIDASLCSANISSEMLDYSRSQMPVFEHRRDDVYMISASVSAPTLPITPEVFYFSTKAVYSSTVFIETTICFGFTNIRCVVPGHCLVATKRIVPRLHLLNPQEISDLFITVTSVQRAVEEMHNCTSSTIVVQDGPDAGQTIPHVHVHILPRFARDFEENDQIYDALTRHDQPGSEIPLRTMEAMMLEAEQIRTIIKRNEIH